MKIFIIFALIIISNVFPGNFAGGVAIIGQIPKGEFKEEGVPAGFGFDLYGLWYPVKELGIGLNLGGTQYGSSKRQIPFNYFSDLVTVTEKTTNNLGYAHAMFRIRPFHKNIRPYFEGLLGAKFLTTDTELLNNNCTDNEFTEEYDDCEIASSNNAWDNTFSYGVGTGIEITIVSLDEKNNDFSEGILSFFINARYLMGNEATYLKEGSITFSNPEDGPVQTTFNPSKSKTDVLQISIGLHFDFD
tara:strand:+ start:6843 stop:7577 length:735 start_codon:yes stop_codon:yes gene_type:complete